MAENPATILLSAVATMLQQEQRNFLAGPLATHLASVEQDSRFQYDPVARNIVAQITKLAKSNPNALVTAQQIDSFYRQIESLHPITEFKTAYAHLFPASSLPTRQASPTADTANGIRHSYGEDDRKVGQAELIVQENQDVDAPHIPEFKVGATFKPELHRFAETAINHELGQFGATNLKVAHKTNGPQLMVYVAQFVTPTGRHSVVVPVQVQNDNVILPEVFGRDDRVYAFSKDGFVRFEQDNAKIASVAATRAADQLRHAETNDAPRNPSALESYLNTDDLEVVEDNKIAPLDVESTLANAVLRKQSKQNQRTISAASEVVSRELKSLGQYKTPVFAGDGKNGDLLFAVQLIKNQKVANVTVPVETRGQTVLFPSVFAFADKQYPLSKSGVETAFVQNAPAVEFSVKTSNLAEAGYNTLRQTVYAAVCQKDYARAQEAIQVTATKFGKEAVANLMKDYQDWILKVEAAPAGTTHVEAGLGAKMTSDDWANSLQREINAVTNGAGITVPKELDLIRFEKYDEPAFEGAIMTSRIDGTQLT
jgi:hypothetical protein